MQLLLDLGYKFRPTQRALQRLAPIILLDLSGGLLQESMLSCAPGRRREGIESMVLARFLTVVLVSAAALPLLLFSCAGIAAQRTPVWWIGGN
jgi:hypothetical protein